jgi:hypothetical protein
MARLSIDITPEEHQKLKAIAALRGQSIKDYVLNRTLSCSPFQGISTRISSLALASVAFKWLPLGKAGDTVNETTVDHALIRGLVTAGPDASRSCLGLETSVG